MNELLAVLCVLGIVLAFVTVVGHGIWVALAAGFRALGGEPRPNATVSATACPWCGHPSGVAWGKCRFCGAASTSDLPATERNDLYATVRQLERLRQSGAIDAELHARLLQTLRSEHMRLAGSRPPVVAMPAQDLTPPSLAPSPFIISEENAAPREAETPLVVVEILDEPACSPLTPQVAAAEQLAPAVPLRPARTLADVLQSFMQEKNIRWGELVSGMLIVGCAVGLVVSFRATLQDTIPYFPGLLFMLATAAIHGAGNYTLRRWNLASTSRGVLIIGTLLVPLNFLAAIILSGPEEKQVAATDPMFIVAVLVGLVSYGAMTYFASRALLRQAWWTLFVAVMGTSAGQIIINRLAVPEMSVPVVSALALLPLASYLVACLGQLLFARQAQGLSPRRAEQILLVLGVAVFALLAPLALLVSKAHAPGAPWLRSIDNTLAQLSPSLSLAAAMVLGVGLVVHKRARRAKMVVTRTTGTALAVFAGVLLFVVAVLAWPEPELLVAVGVVNAALLIGLAVLAELPMLHLGAAACAAVAYLVGFHLGQGTFAAYEDALGPRLVQLLVLGKSSVALTVFAAALGGIGLALSRFGRAAIGMQYVYAAGVAAVVSVVSTLIVAFWPLADWDGRDPSLATPLLVLYAAGLLAAGFATRHPAATSCGSLFVWAALVHALDDNLWIHDSLAYLNWLPERPVLGATVAHAVLTMGLAFVAKLRSRSTNDKAARDGLIIPLSLGAVLSSLAAAPFVFHIPGEAYGLAAGHAWTIAFVWLAAAWLLRSQALATAFQALAAAAVVLVVLAIGRASETWDGTPLDFRFLPVHFVVLALWCALWSAARRLFGKRLFWEELFGSPWPAVDQVLLAVLVRAIVVFAAFGCWPGILAELGLASQFSEWTGRRSHTWGYAPGVWVALGAIYAALGAALGERLSRRGLAGLFVASAAIPLLIAGQFEAEHAVGSALRWTFAFYSVLAAAAICSRTPLVDLARRLSWPGGNRFSPGDQPRLRILALALGGLPVLLVTAWTFGRVMSGEPLGGPDLDSIFGRLGPSLSFAVPLLFCTATLGAYALRERSSGYALGASVLFQATISLGYVLQAFLAGVRIDGAWAVEFVQWSALGLAGYSLAWVAMRRFLEPTKEEHLPLLVVQLAATVGALTLLVVWAGLALVMWPEVSTPAATQLGSWQSFAALVGAALAGGWVFRGELERWGVHVVLCGALAISTLAAAGLDRFDTPLNWLSLHVLQGSLLALAIAAATAVCVLRSRANSGTENGRYLFRFGYADLAAWGTMLGAMVVALATRGVMNDPLVWWPGMLVGAAAVVTLALSLAGRSQPYALTSTLAAALAATYLWLGCWGIGVITFTEELWQFVAWNVLAALAPAAVVLAAEIWCQRRYGSPFDTRFGQIGAQHGVAIGATAMCAVLVAGGLCLTSLSRALSASDAVDASNLEGLLLLAGVGGLLFAALWDRTARYAPLALYVWGLAVVAFLLDQWEDAPLFGPLVLRPELRPSFTLLAVGLGAALYAALTGRLWHSGLYLARWGSRVGIPQTVSGLVPVSYWLPVATLALSAIAVTIEFGVVLTFEERWMRILAGFAPAAAAIGIGSLAQEQRQRAMQITSLLVAGISVVFLGWADISPSWEEPIVLERAIRLLIALASLTFLLGVVVVRLVKAAEWNRSSRLAGGLYGAASLAALLLVLALETAFFVPGEGAPLILSQAGAVAVVLAGLIAGLLSLALLPGRDPLALTEEGRMYYVYGAQVVGALLFAHLYLANPRLFDAGLRAYWPYIVVGISFFGVGAGELFKRARLRVLAEPFENTGAFLPLLPVLGIWIVAAEQTHYSLLLFTVGLLYALLAMLRKSSAAGLAAAVAGNAALWALLYEQDFSVLANPQIWAIPPALSVLVAAQLNRQRLGDESLTGARYAAMLVIYASSTAEIFIRGADISLWPPMILAALSVFGVFAGIGLKIRAFLYLGSSFLMLAILSMVWNAARHIGHIWPWFVFGIGLGIAILILFGAFEKKRKEIGLLIERMRQWER